MPLALFEGARVHARALAALGLPEESERYARFALAVADDGGWPHRAGWVVAEFGAAVRRGELGTGTPPGRCPARCPGPDRGRHG